MALLSRKRGNVSMFSVIVDREYMIGLVARRSKSVKRHLVHVTVNSALVGFFQKPCNPLAGPLMACTLWGFTNVSFLGRKF